MNVAILIGRLGRDPEMKVLDSGKAFCKFTLATQDGRDKTTWHNITVFDRQAELAGRYLSKGSACSIIGRIDNRKTEDGKFFSGVVAQRIEFIRAGDKKAIDAQPDDCDDGQELPF